jgi:hypothetical protein
MKINGGFHRFNKKNYYTFTNEGIFVLTYAYRSDAMRLIPTETPCGNGIVH